MSLDLAIFFWGFAYFLSTLDDTSNAGRISDLNFFGSVLPAAALLEWAALVLLSLALILLLHSKLDEKWRNALLVVATVVFLLVLGEGLARAKVAIFPKTQGFPTYSQELWYRRYVLLNGDGFRDRAHELAKPANIYRLVIVGDSFAFGLGIDRADGRFGEQLARELGVKTGRPWEVITAAQPDTHTLDHLNFLKRMLAYRPDAVILLYVFNDIDYLHQVTRRSDPVHATRSGLGIISPIRLAYRNSYLFQEIYVRLRLIYYGLSTSTVDDPYQDASLLSAHLKDIARFTETARRGGARVGVVPFDIAMVQSSSLRNRYNNFTERASQAGIPVWSLNGVFDGKPFSDLTVSKLDAHPNELAHRLAASRVAEFVLRDAGASGVGPGSVGGAR